MNNPPDPPLVPFTETEVWFESGPEVISNDLDSAVLMVRIGMALNALAAQREALWDMTEQSGAVALRRRLQSAVTCAALTYEASQLAKEEMRRLRELAKAGDAADDLLSRIGQLCAGKHEAADVLKLGRNGLGFHWDVNVVTSSVKEYERNANIVWIELEKGALPVHRLAAEVLAHALTPGIAGESGQSDVSSAVVAALGKLDAAMSMIVEFFNCSARGYLKSCGARPEKK